MRNLKIFFTNDQANPFDGHQSDLLVWRIFGTRQSMTPGIRFHRLQCCTSGR